MASRRMPLNVLYIPLRSLPAKVRDFQKIFHFLIQYNITPFINQDSNLGKPLKEINNVHENINFGGKPSTKLL